MEGQKKKLFVPNYKKVFFPIPRMARKIPFGYEEDKNDPDILNPIQSELEALEQAKVYLKQFSYKNVSAWLTNETGRKITDAGLHSRIKQEQKYVNQANNFRYWAERYQKAAEKAKELEKRTGGTKSYELIPVEEYDARFPGLRNTSNDREGVNKHQYRARRTKTS